MEWSMGEIYNSSEEIVASASYGDIRMFDVDHMTSDSEQEELMTTDGWDAWRSASEGEWLSAFSAVCFLYARTISGKKLVC